MVTYNDKILVPNPAKDGLDTIHPETNTGNVYDFKNNGWLSDTFESTQTELTTHIEKKASQTEYGHVKIGTGINVTGDGTISASEVQDASTTVKGIVKLNDTISSTSTTEAATANAVKMVNDKLKTDWVNITDVIAPFQSLSPTNVRMRKTAGIASIDFQLTLSAATVANTQYTLFNLPQGYEPGNAGVFQITYDAVNPVYINARILPLGAVVIKHNAVIPKTAVLNGNVTYTTWEVLT